MALPKIIDVKHIEELEQMEQDKYHRVLNNYNQMKTASDEEKEIWLGVYSRCLSPSIACKQTGISQSSYKKWRDTDPAFCRAINRCIESAREDLIGSVINRATGYLKAAEPDCPTESGYVEDGSGKPIHYGGSDTLAKTLLAIDQGENVNDSNVTVVINTAAMQGALPPPVEIKSALEHDEGEVEG